MEGLLAGDAPGSKVFSDALNRLQGVRHDAIPVRTHPHADSLRRLWPTEEHGVSIQLTPEPHK